MEKVTVYYFKKYDPASGEILRSKRPATSETIARVQGEAIKETALEVDLNRLDGNGFLLAEG